MSYQEFHKFAQTLTPKIQRNNLRDKVLELTGIPKIRTAMTPLDPTVCRGFYLSAKNQSNTLVKQHGCHLIVLPQKGILNPCWERFVYVKELMHAFDDPAEATDSGNAFETVLNELQSGGSEISPQTKSELKCFWMALASLCPEVHRAEFEVQRRAGHIDDFGIATKLKIPKQYVPHLFSQRFQKEMKNILA